MSCSMAIFDGNAFWYLVCCYVRSLRSKVLQLILITPWYWSADGQSEGHLLASFAFMHFFKVCVHNGNLQWRRQTGFNGSSYVFLSSRFFQLQGGFVRDLANKIIITKRSLKDTRAMGKNTGGKALDYMGPCKVFYNSPVFFLFPVIWETPGLLSRSSSLEKSYEFVLNALVACAF